ncbi:uncharacterized protein LOC135102737 isoform X3 [Scylla paramamosain]
MASTQRYKQEQVEKAVELVRSKQMSLNAASKTFGIPYATLGDKVRGRRPMQPAPKTVLSMEEEKKLVDWLIEVPQRGFGRTKDDLKDMVKTILDDREERTVFKNNRPGKDWMRAFFKRHPEIRERIGQPLGRERAIVTKDALGEWFQQMKHYLDTIDPTLLTSPDRIFNADESGFNIRVCPKTKRIISMTGAKHVYSVTSGTRQQVTMLACSSAMGQYLPPLLIFPYTRDPRFNALEGFEEAFFKKTPNGWITEVVFLSFLRDIFIPKLGEKRPVVLFVDGHSSHHSLAISTLCNENGVILYCLKAHASHLIQPLDQAFFGAIKLAWSEAVRKFQYQTGESVTMCTFARTLKKAWDTTARPELAYKGFVKSGIYPFNPEVVLNSDKLKPSCSFSSAAPVTLPTSASFGITALPACTPTISTSVPSASPAAKSKFPGPEQRTPTLSAFSNIFELMKLSLSLGEGTTLKFMKRYEERYDMDDPPYEDWKVLLEKTLQPASQSLPSTSQPASQPLPSTYQAASQTLPSTSQPASQPLLYTSQPASQPLPSTSQPASQPLPSTSQPASQPLPYTSQPASQPLPSTSQPAPQPLPYTSQPAPQPLPSTKKNSKTIDDYLTLPSFPKKKGLKKTIAVLPCSISGVEYRQMIEEKQRKKRDEEREKMERKRKREERKKLKNKKLKQREREWRKKGRRKTTGKKKKREKGKKNDSGHFSMFP